MDCSAASVESEPCGQAPETPALRCIRWPLLPGAHASPTAILLHGFGHSADVWRATVRFWRTAPKAPAIIAFDLPGHGRSKALPSSDYRIAEIAQTLESEIRALTDESVVLIGHSIGGRIALALSQSSRIRVVGLVLVETGISVSAPSSRKAIIEAASITASSFASRTEPIEAVMKRVPMADRSAVIEYVEHALQPTADGFRLGLDPEAVGLLFDENRDSIWSILENLRIPLAVIRGEYSSFLKESTLRQMRERVSAPLSVAVIPKAGHSLPIERPNALGQMLDHAYHFVTNATSTDDACVNGQKGRCHGQFS